jgi:Leucine-rich repeat (LRR) protein
MKSQQSIEKKPPLTLSFKISDPIDFGPNIKYIKEQLQELENLKELGNYDNKSLMVIFLQSDNTIEVQTGFREIEEIIIPVPIGSIIRKTQASEIAEYNEQLEELGFVNVALGSQALYKMLCKCKKLQQLSFESMFGGLEGILENSDYALLTKLKGIEEDKLICRARGLTELLKETVSIAGDRLKKLSCKNSLVNDDGLDQIAKLSKLQELDLTNVKNLSAEKLSKLIKNLPELQKLNLAGCSLELEDLPLILDTLKTNNSTTIHPLQSLTLPFEIKDPATLQKIAMQTNLKSITFVHGSESYTLEKFTDQTGKSTFIEKIDPPSVTPIPTIIEKSVSESADNILSC